MKRLQISPIAILLGILWQVDALAAEPAIERGKRLYERERCAMCHSIAGEGNRRYPLDGVGGRLGEEELRKWVVAPQEMKPGVKKKPYRLSDEDLAGLVAYLSSLTQ